MSNIAEYRSRLRLLANGAEAPPGWARCYGRFTPGRSPWATLAHRPPGRRDRIVVTELYEPGEAPVGAIPTEAGPGRVFSYVDDDRLPGLVDAVSCDVAGSIDVVRYRPGRRCTLRVGVGADSRFVKVLVRDGDRTAERIAREAVQLWDAARCGAVGFAVAEPLGFCADGNAIHFGVVPGEPIASRVAGVAGVGLVHRLGQALGQLSAAPVRPCLHTDRADQTARTSRAVARAVAAVPELATGLARAIDELARGAAALPPERAVPIHGAPHLEQWLLDGDRLGLVDFDRLAVGEPELDIATFLAELHDESELRGDHDAARAALIAGFDACGPVGLHDAVIDWYWAHKRVAKVARTAVSLRPDADERAARHLAALLG